MGDAFEALGITLPSIIANAVNFLILLFVLRLVLFKPILKMLDDRRERIAEGLNAAETARADAARAQANIQEQLEAARAEGQELVANAQGIAARIQAEAREQASKDRDAALERARAEIQMERDRALDQLRQEFASITVQAAGRVIGESLDESAHRRIIEETLAESKFSGN